MTRPSTGPGASREPARPDPADRLPAAWQKSSWSGYSGNCLEVAGLDGGVIGVRDSKENGHGTVLRFDHAAWSSFLAGVKNGDFSG